LLPPPGSPPETQPLSPGLPTRLSLHAIVSPNCSKRAGSPLNFVSASIAASASDSSIGGDPKLFNLWGEAVSTARTMAASAFPGAIQVSGAAYLRLRHGFLFRPRGTFYLPAVGASQTFILAGRL
jgi:adenylate cyclase